jgi:outer membrane biosynthesis protein TonB
VKKAESKIADGGKKSSERTMQERSLIGVTRKPQPKAEKTPEPITAPKAPAENISKPASEEVKPPPAPAPAPAQQAPTPGPMPAPATPQPQQVNNTPIMDSALGEVPISPSSVRAYSRDKKPHFYPTTA